MVYKLPPHPIYRFVMLVFVRVFVNFVHFCAIYIFAMLACCETQLPLDHVNVVHFCAWLGIRISLQHRCMFLLVINVCIINFWFTFLEITLVTIQCLFLLQSVCRIIDEMDEPTNQLMGHHNYCTQVKYKKNMKIHPQPAPPFKEKES